MRHLAHSGRVLLSWLLATVAINLCGAAARGDAPPKTGAPAATRICVDLIGGGRVVGEPVQGDLRIEGESSSLTLPWAKVQRVVPGLERRPARLKRLLADIEQLSDASFDNRERAQRELLAEGSQLRLILEEIKNDGDLERRTRVRALLKAIGSGEAAAPARLRQDVVVATDQRHVGKIDASFVEVKTAAGVLRVPLDVVESIAPPLDTSPIDLLAKIDLKRDVVFGDWTRDGTTLVSPLQSRARLQIPVVPPANYDLRMTAVAKAAWKAHAPADSLFITVIVAGHQCNVALNAFGDVAGGPFSGMDAIGGQRAHQSPLRQGTALELNKEARIVVSVRGRKVNGTLNDDHLFQWDGDPAKLSVYDSWRLNDARYLGLGAHRTAYHISRFELLPIDAPKQPELAPGEVVVRLNDGTLLPVKIDAEQAIVLQAGGAAKKVPCGSLETIRPASGRKGSCILLTTGETILVEKLPTQAIHLTTRFGPLAPPLDAIATLQRAK